MEQKLLIEVWLKGKLSFNSNWRLLEPITLEHEFKSARFGHPSTYAFVRFEAIPADNLSFDSVVVWTEHISENWIPLYERLICEAIVDGLVCSSTTPFIDCLLKLVAIKYDEVSSSPNAFYQATKEVMAELVRAGKWHLKTHKTD